jgi:hypothetical protein
MAFEFVFHIDPKRIRLQDHQTGYHLEIGNRVVVRQKDGLLLARGLVPYTYRLCMLQGIHDKLSAIDQWLARTFWGQGGAASSSG